MERYVITSAKNIEVLKRVLENPDASPETKQAIIDTYGDLTKPND